MLKNGKIKVLAQMAGILSAVNGGIIGTLKKLEHLDNCLMLHIHLPGIKTGSMSAEIENNYLKVQYFIELNSEIVRAKISNIVYNGLIPDFVDSSRISANFQDGRIDITMPYQGMGGC